MPAFSSLLLSSSPIVPPEPQRGGTHAGMLFACWAIVIVMAAMFVVFMRARKKEYAFAILPLAMTPFGHIFSGIVARWLDPLLPMTAPELRVAIDVVISLIACLLLGVSSLHIREKRNRTLFLVCCSGYIIISTVALVTNVLMIARI